MYCISLDQSDCFNYTQISERIKVDIYSVNKVTMRQQTQHTSIDYLLSIDTYTVPRDIINFIFI